MIEDRRGDVDHVAEVRTQAPGIGDALWPADDHGVARAAQVGADLLAPLERGVPRPRPCGAVVRVHDLGAPLVHATEAFGQLELHLVGQRDAVLHRHLVERTRDGAFHAGAVVAPDPDDHRVVELAELLDRVDHASDVVVGILREAGVDLHLTGVERLQLLGHVVPCREGGIARCQLRVGGDDAELLLAREGLLPKRVPALVELTLVLVRPGCGDVMRRVAAPGREVHEERLVGILCPNPMDPLDGLVRHGVGEVVRDPRRRRTPQGSRSPSGSRSGTGPTGPSRRPGSRRSSRTPSRSASDRTDLPCPVAHRASDATSRMRRCCSRCRAGCEAAARSPSAGSPSSRGTRRRTHRPSRTRRRGCCDRSATRRGSASRGPSRGTGCT